MEPLSRKEWCSLSNALEVRINTLQDWLDTSDPSKAMYKEIQRKIQDDRLTLQKINRHLMFAKD